MHDMNTLMTNITRRLLKLTPHKLPVITATAFTSLVVIENLII